jgi:hypothetical protein
MTILAARIPINRPIVPAIMTLSEVFLAQVMAMITRIARIIPNTAPRTDG